MYKTIFAVPVISLALFCFQAPIFGATGVAPDTRDPQYQAKGSLIRTYTFPGTGESIPYHLYVPANWTKDSHMGLVIVLHEVGQSPDALFRTATGVLGRMAEAKGYIIAAPLGYRVNGDFNNPYKLDPAPPLPPGAAPAPTIARKADPAPKGPEPPPLTAEDRVRSEQDVLNVASLAAAEYNTDPGRVYLLGNYAGALSAWYLAQKYPSMWAGICSSAGPMENPAQYPWDRLKGVSVAIMHSDQDSRVSFDASLKMVDIAKQHGLDVAWIPFKGNHFVVWGPAGSLAFDFFDQHKKQ